MTRTRRLFFLNALSATLYHAPSVVAVSSLITSYRRAICFFAPPPALTIASRRHRHHDQIMTKPNAIMTKPNALSSTIISKFQKRSSVSNLYLALADGDEGGDDNNDLQLRQDGVRANVRDAVARAISRARLKRSLPFASGNRSQMTSRSEEIANVLLRGGSPIAGVLFDAASYTASMAKETMLVSATPGATEEYSVYILQRLREATAEISQLRKELDEAKCDILMLQQHALGESVVSGKTQNDEDYEEEGGRTNGGRGTDIDEVFAKLDTDGDGFIDEKEFQAISDANDVFNTFDVDGNGVIDKNEFRAGIAKTIGGRTLSWSSNDDLNSNITTSNLSDLSYDDVDWANAADMAPPYINEDECLVPGEPVVRVEKAPQNSRRIFAGIDIPSASVDDVWRLLTDYPNLQRVVPNLVVNEVLELLYPATDDVTINLMWNETEYDLDDVAARCQTLTSRMNGAILRQVGGAKVAGINFSARTTLEVREWPSGMPDFIGVVDGTMRSQQLLRESSGRKLKRYVFPRPFALSSLPHRDISMQSVPDDDGEFRMYQGVWRMQPLPGCSPPGGKAMRLTYAVEVSPRPYLPVALVEGRIARDLCANLKAIRDIFATRED